MAGESTTFDVVFLARSLSPVEDTLHIHTSLGILDYKVCKSRENKRWMGTAIPSTPVVVS